MTTANRKPPSRSGDESLEILRRLEPVLTSIDKRLVVIEADQRRMGERLASVEGRVSSLPTIWQIVPAMLAINAGIVAIAFGLVNVLRP